MYHWQYCKMYDISVPLHVSCHEIPLAACNVHSPIVSGIGNLIGGLEKWL